MNFGKNYFTLFQLPEDYSVDLQCLRQRYQMLQKQHHPDRFAAGSAQQKHQAQQFSAYINRAFKTLQSPVTRAIHLLSINNFHYDPEKMTSQDQDFLMQQMSLREQISAVEACSDVASEVDHLHHILTQHMIHQGNVFVKNFNQKNYIAASEAITKMQFFVKLGFELERIVHN